jgi:hypothetical protein
MPTVVSQNRTGSRSLGDALVARDLTAGEAGYTSAPQVVITDPLGVGSGASGAAALLGGVPPVNYGAVYMMTSLAVTHNGTGTRALAQMETAVRPPWRFKLGGALTLAGRYHQHSIPIGISAEGTIAVHDALPTCTKQTACTQRWE